MLSKYPFIKLFLSLALFQSCFLETDCANYSYPDVYKRKFTEDEKKWIIIQDTSALYKYYNNSKIDTVNGLYKIDTSLINTYSATLCYNIYYSKIKSGLKFPSIYNKSNTFINYEMENPYEGDDDFHFMVYIQNERLFGGYYKFDTVLVNGKIYNNVFKYYSKKDTLYLAKNFGWIYFSNRDEKFELIPM